MTKADLQKGVECVEKKPSSHTHVLQRVLVTSVKAYCETPNWDTNKKRMVTYVFYQVKPGTFYPAVNGGYLDGLIGYMKLSKFKSKYQLVPDSSSKN